MFIELDDGSPLNLYTLNDVYAKTEVIELAKDVELDNSGYIIHYPERILREELGELDNIDLKNLDTALYKVQYKVICLYNNGTSKEIICKSKSEAESQAQKIKAKLA